MLPKLRLLHTCEGFGTPSHLIAANLFFLIPFGYTASFILDGSKEVKEGKKRQEKIVFFSEKTK